MAAAAAPSSALDMLALAAVADEAPRRALDPAMDVGVFEAAFAVAPLSAEAAAVARALDGVRAVALGAGAGAGAAAAVADYDNRLRIACNRVIRTLKDHRKVVGRFNPVHAARWPHFAQAPYEWEVGRLVRHALDTDNTRGLLLFGAAFDRTRSHGASVTPHGVLLVLHCLAISLHPNTDEAVALFRRVCDQAPVADAIATWHRRLSIALGYAHYCGARADAVALAHTPLATIARSEAFAKIIKCLSIGSPFLSDFDDVPRTIITRETDWRVVEAIAIAFMQYEANPRKPGWGSGSTYSTALSLRSAIQSGAAGAPMAMRSALLQQLQQFIDMRWAHAQPGGQAVNPVQSDVIAALAEQLARTSVGKSDVIPSILDFVRTPATGNPHGYRQVEMQVAATAFGSAQLARARMEAEASAAAAAARQAGTAAASARRAREEEEEEEEKGDQTAAKRRA